MQSGHLVKKLNLPEFLVKYLPIINKNSWFSLILQACYHNIKTRFSSISKPYLVTSKGWFNFITKIYDINNHATIINNSLIKTSIDPDILVEPTDLIYKGRLPRNMKKPYVRTGSLIVMLQKIK